MSNLTIQFDNQTNLTVTGSGEIFASLEQEYDKKSDNEAKLDDFHQMMARAKGGISAYTFVEDNCMYATTEGESVIITLGFYVWVSQLDLPYSLHTEIGDILPGFITRVPKSFHKVFNDSKEEELGFLFDGVATIVVPPMREDGELLQNVTATIEGHKVLLSEPAYTVVKITGSAIGYKHQIRMSIDKKWKYDPDVLTSNPGYTTGTFHQTGNYDINKYPIIHNGSAFATSWTLRFINGTIFNLHNSNGVVLTTGNTGENFVTDWFTIISAGWGSDWEAGDYLGFSVKHGVDRTGYSVDNLVNDITVAWEVGNEVYTNSITMDIPQCVQDLLKACPDDSSGESTRISGAKDEGKGLYYVYYSVCEEDVILKQGWKE